MMSAKGVRMRIRGRYKMRILVVEDTVLKYVDICRNIKRCCDAEFTQAKTLDEAKRIIEEMPNDRPFDLFVTDMYYPLKAGGEDSESGFKFIGLVNERGLEIPIIICSTIKYRAEDMKNVIGSVQYNKRVDIGQEFEELIKKVKEDER